MPRRALLLAPVAALAALALPTPAAAAPSSASAMWPELPDMPMTVSGSVGPLIDLAPESDDPTDGAFAVAVLSVGDEQSHAVLGVAGLDPAAAGQVFGVHAHTGPCVPGDPEATGPHYQVSPPPSPMTEIWLDITVTPFGTAGAMTTVPFAVPPGGAQSIVIHTEPTAPDGEAGDRLACMPLDS
jgi:hypothetical protein